MTLRGRGSPTGCICCGWFKNCWLVVFLFLILFIYFLLFILFYFISFYFILFIYFLPEV